MAEEESASRVELLGNATEGRAEGQATPEGGRFGDVFGETRASQMSLPPPSPPPLRVWPSERPPPSRSDPRGSNPMRPPIVNHWVAVYNIEGRRGIQEEFYKFAQMRLDSLDSRILDGLTRSNERKSWELLLRDKEERTHLVATLLALLPDKVILALLQGELPIQCKEDPDVRRFVVKHMQPEETPGIYVNLLHNADFRWLSSQDVKALIARLERYLEVEPTGLPRADQRAVDTRFGVWNSESKKSKVRWLQAGRAEGIIREWIETVMEIYCKNPTDTTTAFRMGPAEVGWAINIKARCKQHAINSSTTYIWALLNAICRESKSSGGFAFPKPMQLVLFPIWERDEMLCKVGEVVGSMLCSSYWYLGGLNCFHAGGMNWDQEGGNRPEADLRPKSSHKWSDNFRRVQQRLDFIRPLDEETLKARRLDDAYAESEKSKGVEDKTRDLSIRLERAREECEDLEAKVEATRTSLKLDAAEAALDEIIQEMEKDEDRWIRNVLLKN